MLPEPASLGTECGGSSFLRHLTLLFLWVVVVREEASPQPDATIRSTSGISESRELTRKVLSSADASGAL